MNLLLFYFLTDFWKFCRSCRTRS